MAGSHRFSMLRRYATLPAPLLRAAVGENIDVGSLRLRIPGSFGIRASVLAGTVRVRSVLDHVVRTGGVVADVGANIGYITCLAARRVGHGGRVIAVEPADDNLQVLRANVDANGLKQVEVIPAAAGQRRAS